MSTIDHRYLRPVKAKNRQDMLDSPFPEREDLALWQGLDAAIVPLREEGSGSYLFGCGGVIDRDGNYVALSGIPNRIGPPSVCDAAEYKDEKVVYCGYLVNQWGHFLVEGVTRLWYFLKQDATIDHYVFFVEEGNQREIRGNFREFLELLGIWDKLEIISRPTKYREVLVPEIGALVQRFYSKQYRAVFDAVAEAAMAAQGEEPAPKRIYLSRSQFKGKGNELKEFGHDLLDNFFERNGYLKIHPENFSLGQLIRYMRSAEVVASVSGSLAHNLLFVQQQKQIILLERGVFNDDNQADIDRIRDLNATYIDANICLYTTDFDGPFILGYTDSLKRFAEDNGYCPPEDHFLTEKYRKACFANYMRAYWNRYRLNWFMMDWYCLGMDYMWEGFQDGYRYFAPYLDGEKPYFWYHWLYPHYQKQFIKKVLGKLGLYHG